MKGLLAWLTILVGLSFIGISRETGSQGVAVNENGSVAFNGAEAALGALVVVAGLVLLKRS